MSSGLEGVVGADTVLSQSDPANGRLWVRGVPVDDLVSQHGYEGALALTTPSAENQPGRSPARLR